MKELCKFDIYIYIYVYIIFRKIISYDVVLWYSNPFFHGNQGSSGLFLGFRNHISFVRKSVNITLLIFIKFF